MQGISIYYSLSLEDYREKKTLLDAQSAKKEVILFSFLQVCYGNYKYLSNINCILSLRGTKQSQ